MLTKSVASAIRQLTPYAKTTFSAGKLISGIKCIATPAHQRVGYVEEVSKHRMKVPLYDLEPRTENSWIAPNATLSKKE
jgi:hypothetical protein